MNTTKDEILTRHSREAQDVLKYDLADGKTLWILVPPDDYLDEYVTGIDDNIVVGLNLVTGGHYW